jgi:hypothetical protein
LERFINLGLQQLIGLQESEEHAVVQVEKHACELLRERRVLIASPMDQVRHDGE